MEQTQRKMRDATLVALREEEEEGGGGGHKPWNAGGSLEAGKGNKTDSFLEPPERTQPCQILALGLHENDLF